MHYSVTYEYGPFHCRGTLSGDVTVSALSIEGPVTGANCVREFTGFLRATKQH